MVEYSIIPRGKAYEVAQFLMKHFFTEEPISKALGVTLFQVDRWLPMFIVRSLAENISVMAIDNGQLVGVVIGTVRDPEAPEAPGMLGLIDAENEPNMFQVASFWANVWSKNPNVHAEDFLLMQSFLTVDAKYSKQGISKQLVRNLEENAKKEGAVWAQAQSTSDYSFKSFRALGYQSILELKYDACADDSGDRIFANACATMTPHTCVRIVEKSL